MVSALLTQAMFLICAVLFLRLFTYRRRGARFRRGVSCLAMLVMGCAGAAVIYILTGELRVPAMAWPLVVLLAVFAWAVWQSGGNLAGAFRPSGWDGVERRRQERRAAWSPVRRR
ncbi:phage holin family protein [Stutzerimonas nosocomialis]|uniref:Phage holin family protein n=1 Tax=Stutzerimonas nosocomialis TaxID=1056496 RepID=A0A5R9QIG6_9GAMM|nr:phage holin family protein [Stutzerimonas nosocomialis]TLX65084.1 phage holin family protein [Stutzerimonas nosocomialis]